MLQQAPSSLPSQSIINFRMTQHYWQRYKQQISGQFMQRVENRFWQGVKQDMARLQQPKHHLQLYSMCKSENPYIKQIKNSPNITTETVAEMICRDKACELQYCLSIMKIATENRRRIIDLKGCKEQYDTMWNCIRNEMVRINKREQELRDLVHGVTLPPQQMPQTVTATTAPPQQEKPIAQYI